MKARPDAGTLALGQTDSRPWRLVFAALFALCVAGCQRSYDELAVGEEKVSGEEAGIAARMINAIEDVSRSRYPEGRVLRFNQGKGHGCLRATLEVPALPGELARGLFAEAASYDALLRFASATQFDDREKDFRGLSIKVYGVDGPTPWGEPGTQDFLFNSYPGLFAATPGDFLSFIEATRDDKIWRYFLNPAHWYSLGPILKGRQRTEDPFAVDYFSTTAFRHGETGTAVKYAVRQCPGSELSVAVEQHEDFLADAMAAHLEAQAVCLEMRVQLQTDPAQMPVENASVIWDESQSPFQTVGRILIEDQEFRRQDSVCESMTFSPWQALAAHRPLGGINRVRRAVYSEAAEFRLEENRRRGLL